MPKVISTFEFAPASTVGQASYDWPALLDGKIYECVKDQDFHATPENFASTARWVGAYKHRKIVKTHVVKGADKKATGVVVIQAFPMTDEQVAEYDAKVEARKAAQAAKKQANVEPTAEEMAAEAPPAS